MQSEEMIERWMYIIRAVFTAEDSLSGIWKERLSGAKELPEKERESVCSQYVRAIAEEILVKGWKPEEESRFYLLEKGVEVIHDLFGVNIQSRSRSRDVVDLKAMYCYWMRNERFSLTEIGRFLGIDHSTVHHNYRKMVCALDVPEAWHELVEKYGRFKERMEKEE